MSEPRKPPAAPGPRPMSPFKKAVLALLVLIFVGSVGARAVLGSGQPDAPSPASRPAATPDGFLPGVRQGGAQDPGAAPQEEPAGIEGWLPLLTEGSFFALIGFALGFATKKLVKLLLIFVALFFVGVQALVHAEVMTVDWGQAIDWLNRMVLNLREDQPFTEVLKEKVPTLGALLTGYVLGFRRG